MAHTPTRAELIEVLRGLTHIGTTTYGGIIVGPQGWDNAVALLAKLED